MAAFTYSKLIFFALIFCIRVSQCAYNLIFQELQFPPQVFGMQAQVTYITSNLQYTVISSLNNGIKWISNSQGNTQIISSTQNELNSITLTTIAITQDSQYLFSSTNNKLTMYSVSLSQRFALTLIKQSVEVYGVITNIYLLQNDRLAIILGDQGAIVCYDIQTRTGITPIPILASYHAASKNIQGFIRITDNLQWIFVSDLSAGVYVLQLNINTNSAGVVTSVTMPQAASTYARYTNQVEVTKDLQWMIILESWLGLRIIPLTNLFAASSSSYPITLPSANIWWYNPLQEPVFYGSYVSMDSKYLITAIRSQGIIIFDISNPQIPILYYQIKINGCPTMINMVKGETLLYYTDGIQVLVFQNVPPNMNDQLPNVFNGHQSKLFAYSNYFAQWRCYVSAEQTFVITAQCGDVDFLQLKNGDPYNISVFKTISAVQNTRTCTMAFYDNMRYMYRPVRENNEFMYIYDIQNIANYASSNFPVVGNVPDTNPPRGEDLCWSKDMNLLVVNYNQGIVIYNSLNKFNLVALSYWSIPPQLNGWPSSMALSDDNKYCIVASRTIGTFFLLDISDPTKPNLINSHYTNGAENLTKSTLYNVAYVCDGTAGFAVQDLSALPEFKYISRIAIDGWVNYVTLIQNEQYAIVSSMDYNGMISVIDLTDLKNPIVMSKYIEFNEQSIANCVLNSLEYGFSTSNKGLRIFPLKSSISIHSSFYEEQSNNELKAISNDLFIGQQVQLQLLLIYVVNGMQILNVFYYQNYQRNPLPSWIQFISLTNTIMIQVDKQGSSSQTQATSNILLAQTGVPISSSNFIFAEIPTNSNDSLLIYNFFKEKGTIGSSDIIASTFDPNAPIDLSSLTLSITQTPRLTELVLLTLQRGIYYNPIVFTVSSSLSFDPTNLSGMIQTYSSSVTIQMTIDNMDNDIGTFVEKQYPGVIVSISDGGNTILIYGTIAAVNTILKSQIYYYLDPKQANVANYSINMRISDSLNTDLIVTQSLKQAIGVFIRMKSQVVQTVPLQQQITDQFSASELTVLDTSTIVFLSTTFQDDDNFPMVYEVFIQSTDPNKGFITLASDYWLKFSPASLTFNGIAPLSMLNEKVVFKIIASNGYSQTFDEFYIILSKLPLSYILNIAFSILTPVLSLLGIYKYRYLIVNSIFHRTTYYSKEIVQANQQYIKVILLLDQNVPLAQSIVRCYIKELQKKQKQLRKKEQDETQIKFTSLTSMQKKEHTLGVSSIKQYDKTKSIDMPIQIQKINTLNDQIDLKDIKISEYQTYCQKDGRVDMNKIIADMELLNLKYKFSGVVRYFENDREHILMKHETLLFESIKILMSRYILTKDAQLNDFYNYLKESVLKNNRYTRLDWYKEYVLFGFQDNIDLSIDSVTMHDILQTFRANDSAILNGFEIMQKASKSKNKLQVLDSIRFNLLKDILIGDAIGIVDRSLGCFEKCVGESLWLGMHNIMGIQAHIREEEGCLLPLKSCFKCDYLPYGIQNNMKLPNWLGFSHKGGLIILKGIPQDSDIEQFQIRVSDVLNYTVKKFDVNVIPISCSIQSQPFTSKQLQNTPLPSEQNQLLTKLNKYSTDLSHSKSLSIHTLLQKAQMKKSEILTKGDKSIFELQQTTQQDEVKYGSPHILSPQNLLIRDQRVIENDQESESTSYEFKGVSSPQFLPQQFAFQSRQQNLRLIDLNNL